MRLPISKCQWSAAVVTMALLGLVLPSCRPPKTGHLDAATFERWFVGTGVSQDVLPKDIGREEIDRVVESFRHAGGVGRFVTTLGDTFGMPYSAGYQTPRTLRYDTLYPCVIYLHGGTGSMAANKGDSAYQMLSMLADSMELFLVSPSANRAAPWWSPAGLSRILQTLRYMTLHYPVDPDKVILAGVSDGATGCWAAANTIFAPFAGFIAVSGFGGMLPQVGMELHEVNLMQRPIYNVNAGNDRLYPIDAVNGFLDSIERAGVGVRRTVYGDEQHGFDYRMQEAGVLCNIVREWALPRTESLQGVYSPAFPVCINHCISLEPQAGAAAISLRGYCLNNTFFLHTTGLDRLRMYFEMNGQCAVGSGIKFNINGSFRHCKMVVPDAGYFYGTMKQTCSPVVRQRVYYSITF